MRYFYFSSIASETKKNSQIMEFTTYGCTFAAVKTVQQICNHYRGNHTLIVHIFVTVIIGIQRV